MLAWAKTIFAGFISGVGGGVIFSIGDPHSFTHEQFTQMIWPCIAFGLLGAAAFAVKSPFSQKDDDGISKETLQRYKDRG